MKKRIFLKSLAVVLSAFFSFSNVLVVYGDVITAPIDSRPVSLDYLRDLAELNGEDFFAPSKDVLDMFPINSNYNRFAKSKNVREEIREAVSRANKEDTTVIINVSSYMTAGLVGSRCGENYKDFEDALSELSELTELYSKPTYYVNLSMPRTLPETRMNKIWSDDKKYRGLGYYYVKYNENCDDKVYISSKLARINPEQLLMEWSYVFNKKQEVGEEKLEPWEKDFLKHFDSVYRGVEPYRTYLSKYVLPFSAVSEIFSKLMKMQDEGKIDEIVISNDDFQIPNFITYFNGKGADWIPKENGTPIKFSFARNYITNGPRSIYKLLKDKKGVYEAERALIGKGKNINFIFGTDELPQLIYARDLSKRKNISANFNVISTSSDGEVAQFDVLKTNSLIKNDLNFVSGGQKKAQRKTDLYMFDYNNKNVSANDILKKMNESKKKGRNVGLIEIFSSDVSATGKNLLFKKLLENSKEKNDNIGVADLACYSAWNTNANAIGLGTAHAQVYGIMQESSDDFSSFLEKHLRLLAVHCSEDGFYTVMGKRILTNERFVPVYEDTLKSEKLLLVVGSEEVVSAFKGKEYVFDDRKFVVDEFEISDYNFPWGRLFECYLDFKCRVGEKDRN